MYIFQSLVQNICMNGGVLYV